jgi:hypothetical protein
LRLKLRWRSRGSPREAGAKRDRAGFKVIEGGKPSAIAMSETAIPTIGGTAARGRTAAGSTDGARPIWNERRGRGVIRVRDDESAVVREVEARAPAFGVAKRRTPSDTKLENGRFPRP